MRLSRLQKKRRRDTCSLVAQRIRGAVGIVVERVGSRKEPAPWAKPKVRDSAAASKLGISAARSALRNNSHSRAFFLSSIITLRRARLIRVW